jgi:hypothetical protein
MGGGGGFVKGGFVGGAVVILVNGLCAMNG